MLVVFILVVLLIGNFLTLYNLNEKLDRVDQTLVDLDIIYLKLQQFFRGSN